MSPEDFNEQFKFAREIMKDWPEWKKNILKYSLSPTRTIPRKPISENDKDE